MHTNWGRQGKFLKFGLLVNFHISWFSENLVILQIVIFCKFENNCPISNCYRYLKKNKIYCHIHIVIYRNMTIQLFRKARKYNLSQYKGICIQIGEDKEHFQNGTFGKLSYLIEFHKILSYCILSYFQNSQKIVI